MREEKRVIVVDPDEHRLLVKGLNEFRNDLLVEELPTEDLDGLLLKVIDAPTKTQMRRSAREAR